MLKIRYIPTEEHKKKLRLAKIKYIQKCSNNGEPVIPTIGKNETKILNKIEELSGYKVLRQYLIKDLGYWVDGYIPELDLCIEVDERHHEKNKVKDVKRQQEIERKLNCKFIRIKDY